jgi:crossover junction endodeoxyribonuclease RusA
LEPEFPVEFIVRGTPVSHQSERPAAKAQWKERVKEASKPALPEGHWVSGGRIAVTLFYFPPEPMQGDVDNIVKLVLDALNRHIYLDDRQVERVVVQKFEPGNIFPFDSPSAKLEEALNLEKPILYVRLSNDPLEEL